MGKGHYRIFDFDYMTLDWLSCPLVLSIAGGRRVYMCHNTVITKVITVCNAMDFILFHLTDLQKVDHPFFVAPFGVSLSYKAAPS
jgi:hypothetical protein